MDTVFVSVFRDICTDFLWIIYTFIVIDLIASINQLKQLPCSRQDSRECWLCALLGHGQWWI